MLVVDWKATATQILIYVKNCGVDTVDAFYGVDGKREFGKGSSNGSKKYKHKTNKQYVIISNSGYKILSYGK